MAASNWPVLSLSGSQETLDTFHLWTQIVGKVRLGLEPMVNHWWQITLYVSARGPHDVADARGRRRSRDGVRLHRATPRRPHDRGQAASVPLAPGSIADFYGATMDALQGVGTPVRIYPQPQEMDDDVSFPDDTAPRPYDADVLHQLWLALVQMNRVMYTFRARFQGKVSPVHFFWGAPDLAVTRFSGRTAPRHGGGVPHCADWIQQMAYSHEVSSCGYWPGGSEEGIVLLLRLPDAVRLRGPPGGTGRGVVEHQPRRVPVAVHGGARGGRPRRHVVVVLPVDVRGRRRPGRLGPRCARGQHPAVARAIPLSPAESAGSGYSAGAASADSGAAASAASGAAASAGAALSAGARLGRFGRHGTLGRFGRHGTPRAQASPPSPPSPSSGGCTCVPTSVAKSAHAACASVSGVNSPSA